jgi:hypothetical protein
VIARAVENGGVAVLGYLEKIFVLGFENACVGIFAGDNVAGPQDKGGRLLFDLLEYFDDGGGGRAGFFLAGLVCGVLAHGVFGAVVAGKDEGELFGILGRLRIGRAFERLEGWQLSESGCGETH